MAKFKVGDKVRVKYGRSRSSQRLAGQVGTVLKVDKGIVSFVLLDIEGETKSGLWFDELELVGRKPQFKEGDRVAVYSRFGRRVGTVTSLDDSRFDFHGKVAPHPEEILVYLDSPVINHPDALVEHVDGLVCFPQQCRRLKKK